MTLTSFEVELLREGLARIERAIEQDDKTTALVAVGMLQLLVREEDQE